VCTTNTTPTLAALVGLKLARIPATPGSVVCRYLQQLLRAVSGECWWQPLPLQDLECCCPG
jgi:hypothetical protein